eukprot:TRINITY_DN19795_c0_g1_i4.p1 TRINITY_DN19795_c0_g1~~TRINITY_DN19795_c0_g1_i4.p1  ORF type:complete len:191 (+),score=44.53 TRINITY_DN19795_c0_g1_i4:99-671(+)
MALLSALRPARSIAAKLHEAVPLAPDAALAAGTGSVTCEKVISVSNSADFWRCQVEAVYRRRNPHKLSGVEALLQKYKGKEVVLYAKVCKAYDLDSSKFYADPTAWEQYDTDVQEDKSEQDSSAAGPSLDGSGVSVPSLFGITALSTMPKPAALSLSQLDSDDDEDADESRQTPPKPAADAPASAECKTQ